MKYVDEFRNPEFCEQLVQRIRSRATRSWTVMEVCGGQTHSLLKFAIDRRLHPAVQLIHGPGCPVCVTPIEDIDTAIQLAMRPGVILASFGDMLRVPGSQQSLLQARANGATVRIVYSPIDAIRIAQQNPQTQVVFFAVGFETTAAATALTLHQAKAHNLDNFAMLAAHVRVLPAMEALAAEPSCRIHAFLAAGHVCTVDGYANYDDFVRKFQLPVVVAGFEPVDLLSAIDLAIAQLEEGRAQLHNAYKRSARREGNPFARKCIEDVFMPTDANWRGIGPVPAGGMAIRPKYEKWDARRRFPVSIQPCPEPNCPAGDVLTGRIKPTQCPHFGNPCTPDNPLGAPMVSAEGACAAYFRYTPPENARIPEHAQ